MELFTRSFIPEWDRVVYLCVENCAGVSEHIADRDMYKIMIVDRGSVTVDNGGNKKTVTAPAFVLIPDEEVSCTAGKDLHTTTIFFKPTEVRDEFTPERIRSGEFEEENGKTIHQDYLLVRSFERTPQDTNRVVALDLGAYHKIVGIVERMNEQLQKQPDGYWPCRSRSYLMELLYFISYVKGYLPKVIHHEVDEAVKDDTVSEIIRYLSEHIADKVSQEDIMKEFSLNRNRLNEIFIKETSMTCMNYLAKMRINLAQMLLAETALLVGEISGRVGYEDSNYFIKVFKKHTGVTPTKYRENFWA